MPLNTPRANKSAAAQLVPRPAFGDGDWHRLDELMEFERQLLEARQRNKSFSDAVRVDGSRDESLRHKELIPFLDLAQHEALPPETRFRKPTVDRGIDIEVELGTGIQSLQITTAYPALFDKTGQLLNGGYQRRLHMEKLTLDGMLSGSGPFERRGNHIWHHGGCTTWDQIDASSRIGLIVAFKSKSSHGCDGVTLLVKATDYFKNVLDATRFYTIVDEAAAEALPMRFSRVVVVDYGPGFIWSSAPDANCRASLHA